MTRPEMIEEVLKWDRAAIARKDVPMRKRLWRLIDDLDHGKLTKESVELLDSMKQTEAVIEIRKGVEHE